MRKIDLTPYEVAGGEIPASISKGIEAVLFYNPNFKLSSSDLRRASKIMDKVEEGETTNVVLLEEEEYKFLLRAVSSFVGFRRNDLEFVDRIESAKETEVKEK